MLKFCSQKLCPAPAALRGWGGYLGCIDKLKDYADLGIEIQFQYLSREPTKTYTIGVLEPATLSGSFIAIVAPTSAT